MIPHIDGISRSAVNDRTRQLYNITRLQHFSRLCNVWWTYRICSYQLRSREVSNYRGVQYVQCVHWVMHKCIMVKVGGTRNTRKVCKKQVNLSKTGGKNNFHETGGNVLKQRK